LGTGANGQTFKNRYVLNFAAIYKYNIFYGGSMLVTESTFISMKSGVRILEGVTGV
jgi:hypothetical protein